MCETFLLTHYKSEIKNLLTNPDKNLHYSVDINFVMLFDYDPALGNKILKEPDAALAEFEDGLVDAQNQLINEIENKDLIVKTKVHCRIFGLPTCPELYRTIFPNIDDNEKFLQISGTVIRMTESKVLEVKRVYVCSKCKYKINCNAEFTKKNIITPPKKCPNPDYCKGSNFVTASNLESESCIDYQEIKLQEQVSQTFGSMPSSIWVTLDNDLVGSCKPGDNVTICGTVKQRWTNLYIGKSMDIEIVLKANHVQINNISGLAHSISIEVKEVFKTFWEQYKYAPILGRDTILKSFCPQIFGMYIVKLAIAVTLAGGSHLNQEGQSETGVRTRSEPHLLLVGDPGTGKSQLLRFAAKVTTRSVLTTGVGSTAAGLTATAFMENGGWQIEGGALVLADGGVCCIDEFNSMRQHDRTSILEAMEQQTISVAKASVVSKLSTRCSIIAAGNAKTNVDLFQPLSVILALPSPLLSRFDLILLIKDTVRQDWDKKVADYILNGQRRPLSKFTDNTLWTVEMLQSFFSIIRKNNPLLSEDANQILGNYYQLQRRQTIRNKARTTVRLLDSLIRLSQGHARLLFHTQVEIIDAVTAILLVEIGMGSREDSVLNLNVDIHNDFPDDSLSHYMKIVTDILEKLNLEDLIEVEFQNLEKGKDIILARSNEFRAESKYFRKKETKPNNDVFFNLKNNIVNSEESTLKIERPLELETLDNTQKQLNQVNQNNLNHSVFSTINQNKPLKSIDISEKANNKIDLTNSEHCPSNHLSTEIQKRTTDKFYLNNEDEPNCQINLNNSGNGYANQNQSLKSPDTVKKCNDKVNTDLTASNKSIFNKSSNDAKLLASNTILFSKNENIFKSDSKSIDNDKNKSNIKNILKQFVYKPSTSKAKPRNADHDIICAHNAKDDDLNINTNCNIPKETKNLLNENTEKTLNNFNSIKIAELNKETENKINTETLTNTKSIFEDDTDVDSFLDTCMESDARNMQQPTSSKNIAKFKFKKKDNSKCLSDIQMLNLIPSINDGLDIDFDFLDEDIPKCTDNKKRNFISYMKSKSEKEAKKPKLMKND